MVNDIYLLDELHKDSKGDIIIYITSDDTKSETKELYECVKTKTNKPFSLYALKVKNWDEYLTPWPMQMGNRFFAGNADVLLDRLKKEVLPKIQDQADDDRDIFIVGYSLAGLFALLSIYKTDLFAGAVSCSGSLWYEGFREYISCNKLQRNVKVYLSLGDKEKASRNKYMKSVEDNTLFQKEIFENSDKALDVCFVLNKGGHFDNVLERISDGIIYILGGDYNE